MVDSSDEAVIELAYRVDPFLVEEGLSLPPRGEPLSAEAQMHVAYALRDLVHAHISDKHLSTAYASASETARTGSGDCTEHAVLLAAVLKARGIPARVCHGLVYVEQGGSAINGEADEPEADDDPDRTGQFGWHMWSQVGLLAGIWRPSPDTAHLAPVPNPNPNPNPNPPGTCGRRR